MQEQPRSGPGRPPKALGEKRVHLDITLSPEIANYLVSLRPINASQFIERLIKEHQERMSIQSKEKV